MTKAMRWDGERITSHMDHVPSSKSIAVVHRARRALLGIYYSLAVEDGASAEALIERAKLLNHKILASHMFSFLSQQPTPLQAEVPSDRTDSFCKKNK